MAEAREPPDPHQSRPRSSTIPKPSPGAPTSGSMPAEKTARSIGCGIDGKDFEQFAKVAGGFMLGPRARCRRQRLCLRRAPCLRSPDHADGRGVGLFERQCRAADAGAELSGLRRCRKPLRLGLRRVRQEQRLDLARRGRAAMPKSGTAAPMASPTACAFRPTGGRSCRGILAAAHLEAGDQRRRIGRREERLVELPRQVPDGVALDRERRPLHQPLQPEHHLPLQAGRRTRHALRRLGAAQADRPDQHRVRRTRTCRR